MSLRTILVTTVHFFSSKMLLRTDFSTYKKFSTKFLFVLNLYLNHINVRATITNTTTNSTKTTIFSTFYTSSKPPCCNIIKLYVSLPPNNPDY